MTYKPKFILDGKEVEKITAFLFHAGGHEDPKRLAANAGKSFIGSYVLGMGFTFDDSNEDATSIAEMHRLIEQDPRNQERIFPYIGGEEVNSSPAHSHHRYVINFGEMTEEEAWQYPDLMQIVKEKVKPERDVQKRDALRLKWWQYAEKRPGLVKAIAPLEKVLVCAQTSKYRTFTFLPQGMVFDQKLVVFAIDDYSRFSILHSQVHEGWARFLGKEYYEYRAQLMIANNQGLTATYNRFHDPDEYDPAILKLRDLHNQMDRAVLDAYGWTDDIRDEVLARLLELNEERYQEELLRGDKPEKKPKSKKKTTKNSPTIPNL